jgi:hypothetical protein
MNISINRFTDTPLSRLSVATLRRWYWGGGHPWLTDIHRFAIVCELERRNYPVDDWPQYDPLAKLSTEELRKIESSPDLIAAHAARDELIERGYSNRQLSVANRYKTTGAKGKNAYLMSFAGC